MCFVFCVQLCMYRMYSFYFEWGLLAAANQITAFKSDIVDLIINNIFEIIVFFVPFIALMFVKRKPEEEKAIKPKDYAIRMGLIVVCIITFNLIYKDPYITTEVSINQNGVIATILQNTSDYTDNDFEVIEEEPISKEETVIEVKRPKYHGYDIDFDSLIEKETDENTLKLHKLLKTEFPQWFNEYTGYFEDKNLVLILAESFNDIAVKEDLTPTLYKMINDGFTFTNYYSTSYNSTIGGELQLNTGLYAWSSSLEPWKQGTNYFPFSIPNLFRAKGYSTYAYHNNVYTYMNRDVYLNNIGYDNYLGVGNGMEEYINTDYWPCSDLEMIDGSYTDYINDDKFLAYYVTVSGHGPYSYNGNAIASKYQELIKEKGYDYPEKVSIYLSTMIELDRSLESLMNHLKDAGKLDDTVFVVVGDHYPYYLEEDEIAILNGSPKEMLIDCCENSLIIYNSSSPKVTCEKVGNTFDVMPTIYNLFNINYDSRLFVGNDLLSKEPGFAIFGNSSWVSDYGKYYANEGRFINSKEIDDGYLDKAKAMVRNKMLKSSLIISCDYYRKLYPNGYEY